MSSRVSRCECGQRKQRGAIACERCTYLDGSRNAAVLVAALRQMGPLTVRELTEANGGLWRETTQRTLQCMLRSGRVRRYWREGDPSEVANRPFGGARLMSRVGFEGSWVYALTENSNASRKAA